MEVWKTIKGFEDYKVSNLGNVKSLKFGKEKILKQSKDGDGYLKVNLHCNSKKYTKKIHKLVSMCFLNNIDNKLVVDHIDNNPNNNNLNNLQLITNRKNVSKNAPNKYSKLTGVTFHIRKNKYKSTIGVNNKNIHLGYFNNEQDAHLAYINKLKEIDNT
jgi:hypothetical protein